MKKMLFLMLFLMILGAVNVSAQVRIGGNSKPNEAAVLDLNATDAVNAGTQGLALPRVALGGLTGDAALLAGKTPTEGMLVYNTNTGLSSGVGLYYWVTDTWVKVSAGSETPPSGDMPLNVTAELDADYTVTADNDIILFTTTISRTLTLPTTGITIGKKLYISDIGPYGVSLYPPEALRDPANSMVWAGFPVTLIFVGKGKWQVLNVWM